MKIRKLLSWFSLFLVSLVIAVSCTTSQTPTASTSSSSPTSTTPASSETSVSLGYSAWPGWFPWKVAQEQKIFNTNKINVDLKWFDNYTDSINGLTASKLNANSQTLNDTLSPVASGADEVIVLVNDNSTGNDQIIARPGINTVADLKGKKVAAEEGTVDHFLLLLGLKKADLTQADIQFQPLETGAAAAAFAAGRVDAVGVFAPFTTKALSLPGSKALFTSKDFPGAIPDHLVVSRKMIEERPQDVQAMVDAWFATLDYIQKNPGKADEIMAKRAGVSVADYKQYNAGTKIFTLKENLEAFSPGKDMTHLNYAAEQISQFLLQTKLIKKTPDMNKLFDDRFVKAYAAKIKKA
ncbi:MAG: ABC transporter substrate-binding protein [Chroococcidiopsidaceae cyanobacterium CP_BM_ER_R8_30]|nr:ABC transporter substrate-binding protein [Chroococcidiopsidaceae cyanobacterium CP_BM_ER_R8_30]